MKGLLLIARPAHPIHAVVLALACSAALTLQAAEPYPVKPIRFLLGPAASSGTDTVARIVAQKLSERVGQSVIVDNRPGAGGTIAASIAVKAVPDGYTVLFVSGSYAVNPALYRKLPFDPMRDLVPVTLMAVVPYVLVVHPSVPAQNLRDLLALARAKPGFVSYGSGGVGSASHLAGELFQGLAGIKLNHVPYKGGGPALLGVLGGQINMLFTSTVNALALMRQGKVRALAVTSTKRSTVVPELPMMIEAGVPGYETGSWYGLLAPAGVPRAVIGKLNREIGAVLKLPEVEGKLAADGAEPAHGTPEQFAAFIQSEMARAAKIVRDAGIRVE